MTDNDPRHNETIRLLHERASCRSFENKKIPDDIMRAVLEAGVHAPTGGNLQPYSIIKIENEAIREKLAALCGDQKWIAEAPVNLLFCIDGRRLERWARLEDAPYTGNHSFRQFWISFQDVIIAAQNICTAADAVGLGSVYIGTVLECFRDLRPIFELPDGVFPVVLLCLGYPKLRPGPRPKLGVETVVHDEKYRDLDDRSLKKAFDRKYSSRTFEPTTERLEKARSVCTRAHGPEFAARCAARIERDRCLNMAQMYFALHYCADEMPEGNEDFLAITEEFGFGWFKKFEPFKPDPSD